MNDSIVIAVDGQNGDLVAESSGIRRATPDPSTALIRYGESRDGQHGVNASQPISGAPAGFMAVKLSESTSIEEGIHVRVLNYAARLEPPAAVEIPTRKDVLLTAIGGAGEPGRNGGEGQNGTKGVDGQDATRETDATAQMAETVETQGEEQTAPQVATEEVLRSSWMKTLLTYYLQLVGTYEAVRVEHLGVTVSLAREVIEE
ncbi:MAG: hypothetical protein Q9167_003358 [Letrouitia subvulpina]